MPMFVISHCGRDTTNRAFGHEKYRYTDQSWCVILVLPRWAWNIADIRACFQAHISDTVWELIIHMLKDKMCSWWRHQMETFSALLAICAGNSPVPGEFPAQRPVTRSFDVFFDLRLNKRLSKQSWGWWFETLSRRLWRHCNVLESKILIQRGHKFAHATTVELHIKIWLDSWN